MTGLEELLQTAIHHGITTIDLADVYGWYADGEGKANDLLSKVFMRGVSRRVQGHRTPRVVAPPMGWLAYQMCMRCAVCLT